MKKIFEINALKLGATSDIIDELREIFRKIKDLKNMLNVFENILAAEFYVVTRLSIS